MIESCLCASSIRWCMRMYIRIWSSLYRLSRLYRRHIASCIFVQLGGGYFWRSSLSNSNFTSKDILSSHSELNRRCIKQIHAWLKDFLLNCSFPRLCESTEHRCPNHVHQRQIQSDSPDSVLAPRSPSASRPLSSDAYKIRAYRRYCRVRSCIRELLCREAPPPCGLRGRRDVYAPCCSFISFTGHALSPNSFRILSA